MELSKLEVFVVEHIEIAILLVMALIVSIFIWLSNRAEQPMDKATFVKQCVQEIGKDADYCERIWLRSQKNV